MSSIRNYVYEDATTTTYIDEDISTPFGTRSGSFAAVNTGAEHENNTNVMVNYQWSPVQNVNMGVELQHFMVDELSGADGDASRVLFAGQYNF
ncbi:hypothetical protein C8D92_106178 [Tamilnaduibacter salinus]|uniref:Porin n=1 Tax=Tamilnaduibacter salinus TaxID=1484056 RepID=A0A2U1CVZ7_9GAMM|nr:hypothetical protein [Tamilnaduibacter salinus]PVY75917.1 hypothetical protein C8D92_106178 [Tamilnaduibacter salinus]